MSAYDDFAEAFLEALYLETEKSGQEFHSADSLIKSYGLTPKPHWISRLADDWEGTYIKDVSKSLGSYSNWSFRISAAGAKKVEQAIEDEEALSAVFGSDRQGSKVYSLADVVTAPGADRVVGLDHNSAQYSEVKDGLAELISEARGNNAFGETPDERDRIIRSLDSANELWRSLELKVVQIRVGIILAIEDAGKALQKVGKETAWSMLIDLLKRIVKDKVGIEI